MIVWGGWDGFTPLLIPAGDTILIRTVGQLQGTASAPSARSGHSAVWTASEMIVWGGNEENTGGRYNPTTNSWVATSTANAPIGRDSHTAVWTGGEMIVWGGSQDDRNTDMNTGGRYNSSTDTWTATSVINVPHPRTDHTAVWTGSEMIVWGGEGNGQNALNTGGRYDPDTDSWIATRNANAPTRREGHTAVWTGNEMNRLGWVRLRR